MELLPNFYPVTHEKSVKQGLLKSNVTIDAHPGPPFVWCELILPKARSRERKEGWEWDWNERKQTRPRLRSLCSPVYHNHSSLRWGYLFSAGSKQSRDSKGRSCDFVPEIASLFHILTKSETSVHRRTFPSTYQFVMSRKQYFSTQSTWNVSNSNFFFFNERQFEMLIFSFKFLTLCSRTSPPKQLLTFQKYLAGVSSHGVNRVTWVGVKNLSDPSLHRV